METHPLGEEAAVEEFCSLKLAAWAGWTNQVITQEGCKSLGYCCFGIMNWGESLGFFQVCVYSEKQLCKNDCSLPVLLVSRWRSKALLQGKLSLAVLGWSWADAFPHQVLVGKPGPSHVCNPFSRGDAHTWMMGVICPLPTLVVVVVPLQAGWPAWLLGRTSFCVQAVVVQGKQNLVKISCCFLR